jgi:secondary thiamine-phosphate synthase enzyme
MIEQFETTTRGQGLYEITSDVCHIVTQSEVSAGLCTLFLKHTSASLLIQENADPSAQNDIERWINRCVPENDSIYTHTTEGPDDMPAHIKAMLTQSSLSIPIVKSTLSLGTWQGIFLFEHRHASHCRTVVVHLSQD